MTPLLIYLLKVNLVIGVLFLAYYCLLRKERFFGLNRMVLLSIIGLSLGLPLLPAIEGSLENRLQRDLSDISPFASWERPFEDTQATVAVSAGIQSVAPHSLSPHTTSSAFTVINVLQGLYILVAMVLILRLFFQLWRVYSMIKGSRREKTDGIVYCHHELPAPPFSFFHYLVLNKSQYEPAQVEQIIAHEQVHIRQRHGLDLLLVEFLHALFWINPLMVGLKRAIKLNLEFIADEKALGTGIDPRSYQYSLLLSLQHPGLPLVNLFASSKIKLRIHMINAKRSPLRNLYKYALSLPLLAGTYLIVNPLKARSMPLVAAGTDLPARQDLKAFEGYYQADKNVDTYIQIRASGEQLILKQLWDDREIPFKQLSDLEFSALDGQFPLKFSKDTRGAIVQVLAFNRDIWKKVDKYTPVTYIHLQPEQLKPFEGFYRMQGKDGKMDYIQIIATDDGLLLRQGWDGQEIPFKPRSATEFYCKKAGFPLEFTRDKNGNVTQVTAFHRDVWKKMQNTSGAVIKKEIRLEPAQLKTLEGEYHFQGPNGENANVRISAVDGGIVLKQLWDGQEVPLVPASSTEFFAKERSFPIVFTLDKEGNAKELLAFGKDRWEKIKVN